MQTYLNRLNILREKIKQKDLDSVIITSPENVFYLSGFTGYGDAYLLITGNNQFIITDSRYTIQAKEQCAIYELLNFSVSDYSNIYESIKNLNINCTGFENERIAFNVYNKLKDVFSDLKNIDAIIEEMRIIKSEEELTITQEACNIACEAFNHVLDCINDKVTENDIAAELEYYMKKRGALRTSFDTIVASGIRGALPHGVSTGKRISKNEAITMDFGAFYKGYCSDITRTVFLGSPDERLKHMYETVLNANKHAIESYKAGMTGFDVDLIARKYIEDAGYKKEFSHGLGHGVGIEVHEEPRVNRFGKRVLCEGMVFSIEPGIYIEGVGGVRIEDLVTPVDGKLKVLTMNASKELIMI